MKKSLFILAAAAAFAITACDKNDDAKKVLAFSTISRA